MLICMHMLTKRTNILFDQHLWNQLTKLSKKQNASVGELIRTAVEEYYELKDDTQQKIQRACNAIEATRKRVKGKLDYKDLINYGRKV